MDKITNFYEDLKDSSKAEKLIYKPKRFKKIMSEIAKITIKGKLYYYGLSDEDTEKQRNGIDGSSSIMVIQPDIEVKTSSYWPKDKRVIFLETHHEGINHVYRTKHGNNLGWFHTSKADIIIWVIWGKNGKGRFFCDGYYLFLKNIKEWIKTIDYNTQPNSVITEKDGNKWKTYCIRIPPQDFPDNCILPIKKSIFKIPPQESYFKRFFKFDKSKKSKKKTNRIKTQYNIKNWC